MFVLNNRGVEQKNSDRVNPRGGVDAHPTQKIVGLKPQYHLIFDSKAYIPNFRALEPYYTTIPGVGVGGGGWGWGGMVKTRYNAKSVRLN